MSWETSSYEDEPVVSDINVTALVDVTLVILIVFMITFPTIVGMAQVKIELPDSGAAELGAPEALPINLYLRHGSAGEVIIYRDTQRTSETGLRDLLKGLGIDPETQPVTLGADKDIVCREMVHVMDTLADLGIRKISLSTKQMAK